MTQIPIVSNGNTWMEIWMTKTISTVKNYNGMQLISISIVLSITVAKLVADKHTIVYGFNKRTTLMFTSLKVLVKTIRTYNRGTPSLTGLIILLTITASNSSTQNGIDLA